MAREGKRRAVGKSGATKGARGGKAAKAATPGTVAESATDAASRVFFESPGVMRGIIELVDDDILHIAVNTTTAAFRGMTPGEINGRRSSEIGVPAAVIVLIRDRCLECRRIGEPVRYDYQRVTPGGEERHLRAWVSPVGDGPVGPRFAYATVDVTDVDWSDARLRMSEQSLRAFFDSPGAMRGIVEVVGDEIRCVVVNRVTADVVGMKAEQLAGRTASELGLSADNQRRWVAQFLNSRESGEPVSFVSKQSLRGSLRTLRATINFAGAGQAGPRFAYSAEDITEFVAAEDALRRSEESFAALVRNLSGAVYRCRNDPDWTVDFISEGCVAVTGYTPAQVIGGAEVSLGGLMHPDDAPAVWANCQASLKARRQCSNEYRITHQDGSTRWVWDRAQGIYSDAGELLHIEGLLIDITERRREADERQVLREHLYHAQRVDSIGRLAGGVAHDFNNLLAVVLGHTDLIAEQLGPSHPMQDHVTEIRSAAQRSNHLTRQLLGFARRQPIDPKVIDLNVTITSVVGLLRRLIGEAIELRWTAADDARPVRIDPTQVDQVLTNLCVNARDALDGAGRVSITTKNVTLDDGFAATHRGSRAGEFTELRVEDGGSGMDADTLANMFDPFFTTKALGQGTGLGLATVYGIVKQNDGYVDVVSAPGKGTSVRVYFPRHAEPAGQESATIAARPAIGGGNETVLLVEDEVSLLRLGQRLLRQLGYTVIAASSPAEALALSASETDKIQLLITDVVMPGMNGRELAARLRARNPRLPVVLMSGYPDAAFEGGTVASDVIFIEKPFTPSQLAAKLREALAGVT